MSFNESIVPVMADNYEVRLLKNADELKTYQELRYNHVLVEGSLEKQQDAGLDTNHGYDENNSQLCVFYNNPKTGKQELVGGYILMRFREENSYCKSSLEYDLTNLLKKNRDKVLETSRVVIHPDHRNGVVLRILWSGLIEYIKKYNMRYIIGIVNFDGLDPTIYHHAASYLYYNYLMPEDIMVNALPDNNYPMNKLDQSEVNREEALRTLPPILKGYLLQGAHVGKGMFIDREFQSVDVFVCMDFTRYGRHMLK